MQDKISIQEVQKRLKESGLKATPQRLVIFHALLKRHDHPTAEQLRAAIHKRNPAISLGTVYKTMDTLVEAGLASKVTTSDGVLRFDGKTRVHGHLHCTRTGRILDYEDDELETLLTNYFQRKKLPNFEVGNFQLHVTGQLLEPLKK
jgi:Fur family transcriptional regulator, peroxide stress response regulator